MSAPEKVVIIGAGQGGFQMAASLRQDGFAGTITLIGDEPGLPYQRPPLSKAYLKDGDPSRLSLRPASFYDQNGIVRVPGTSVTRIDRGARAVETETGARFSYDHLVLAMGARNAVPPIAGLDLTGVFALRTLADAEAIRQALPTARRAVVVGGGFIGLEFAAVARAAGLEVTVVEATARLMARAVSPAISAYFLAAHRSWGTRVELGVFAAAVLSDDAGRARGLRLADGREVPADMVLIATGVVPATDLASAAGLEVANGIVVGSDLVTSDPDISALGDCAAFPDPVTGQRVRLESVQAATDHARTIARRLTGFGEPYTAVPWFWSDQGDLKLQIAGLTNGSDAEIVLTPAPGKTVVLCFRHDRLLGVETVNAAGEHMAARRLLADPGGVTRDQLADAAYDLKAVLAGRKEGQR